MRLGYILRCVSVYMETYVKALLLCLGIVARLRYQSAKEISGVGSHKGLGEYI